MGYNDLGEDQHKFRKIARTQPGVLMANVIASHRHQLGSRGMDHDVNVSGSVFRKWFDSVFLQRFPKSRIDRGKYDELVFLVHLADEFMHGRMLEVGDILYSRLRFLNFGIESGKWNVAEQLLPYTESEHALVPDNVIDEAVKLARRAQQREHDLATAARGSNSR